MANQADGIFYARLLGAEIRNRRLARGMSLRKLARELGLAGHGTLVDYEYGRRIPPEDLVLGCERVFEVSDGALQSLRHKALTERADHRTELLLVERSTGGQMSATAEPAADPAVEPVSADYLRRHWPRPRRRVTFALAALTAVVVGLGIWQLGTPSHSSPVLRPAATASANHTPVARWGICWGGQAGRITPTDAVTYARASTLQITVDKPNSAGDFAVCTIHGLASLHSGMKVTVVARVSEPEPGSGIGFFVYNSSYTPVWALQTPKGDPAMLPTRTDWQQYTWTVPRVDKVLTIGMEVYSVSDHPLIVWLGAVNW